MADLSRRALLSRLTAAGALATGAGPAATALAREPRRTVRSPLWRFPSLFGSREVPADGLYRRLPGVAVLARSLEPPLEMPAAAGAGGDLLAAWANLPEAVADLPPLLQLEAVNRLVNRVRYVSDRSNYGVVDHWATPAAFFARGGDCEDYVIAKFVALRRLGFHESRIRMALVRDTMRRLHHSLLVACPDETVYVLDNQTPAVLPDGEVSRYTPVCSFNSRHLWLHRV